MSNKIELYGLGFIELMDSMGSDATIVNAARISYWKEVKEFGDDDKRLIKFLVEHNHNSPLRHVQFQFRVEAPEFVCRQWWKHQVGMGYTSADGFNDTPWNEASGRYMELPEKFWQPTQFRFQGKKNKQVGDLDIGPVLNSELISEYDDTVQYIYKKYKSFLDRGVCKEQARALLPVGFISSFIMTTSLAGAVHFIKLRKHEGAQKEIVVYAEAMEQLVKKVCPFTAEYLLG